MADANAAAAASFQAYEWLQMLALGGLLGAMGQTARALVGLKKMHDTAAATPGQDPSDLVQPGRLIVSLLIGFVAGALGALAVLKPDGKATIEQVFGLAAAGYAGTDFIEGFVRRIDGSTTGDGGTAGANGAPAASVTPDPAVG